MSSYDAACAILYAICTSEWSSLLENENCAPPFIQHYTIEEQIKSCHTAAEARWVWSITCCQSGRLPVCWYMFCAAHSFSISAQSCLKIPDIFEWANSQTKTEPVSFHWDGVIPGHLLVRRTERWCLWRRKFGCLFWSVPCLWWWHATSCTEQQELVGLVAVKAITENKETL